jgi:hypothetical protein
MPRNPQVYLVGEATDAGYADSMAPWAINLFPGFGHEAKDYVPTLRGCDASGAPKLLDHQRNR